MDVCPSISSSSCSSASSCSEDNNEVLDDTGNTNFFATSARRLLKISVGGAAFYININVFTYYSKKVHNMMKDPNFRSLGPSRAIEIMFENESAEKFYFLLQHICPFNKGVYPLEVKGSSVRILLELAVCYEFADLKLKCLHFLRVSTPKTQKEDLYPLFRVILTLQRDNFPSVRDTTDTVHEYEVLLKISVRLLHDGQANNILKNTITPPDYVFKALKSIYRLRHHNRQPVPNLFSFRMMAAICEETKEAHDHKIGRQCVDCSLIDCESCTKRSFCLSSIRRALDVHTKRASPALICDSKERHPNTMPCSKCIQLLL